MWLLIAGAALGGVVGDGGDGTVIVESDLRRAYSPDGRLLSIGPVEGLTPAASASLRGTTLVAGACEVEVGSVQRRTRITVGQGFAVLASEFDLLAVDLHTCAPVGALHQWNDGTPLVQAGPVLTVVSERDGGVVMDHFTLPTLEDAGRGASVTLDLLASPAGPARVVRGAVLAGDSTRALPATLVVQGGAIVELGVDGAIAVRDGDGATRAQTSPGATHSLSTATRDPRGWTINHSVRVDDVACLPQARPLGTTVACGDVELGVVPVWPVAARATEDGAVLVTADADAVVAWSMARRAALWRVHGPATAVAVGPDWVASRTDTRWTFRDPADGRVLGVLEPDGSLVIGDDRAPFDPARVRGARWDAPTPSPVPAPPPSPFGRFHRYNGCQSTVAHLDDLAPWPAAWAAARRNAAFQCRTDPSRAEVPSWDVAPSPERGGWAWQTPERVSGVIPMGDGAVLVEGAHGLGVLGADGAPRWVRRREPYQAFWRDVAPGIIVQRDLDRSVAWDAVTGEVLWSRLGAVKPDPEGWRWEINRLQPPVAFDVARGEPASTTPFHDAYGLRCGGGACRPAPARAEGVVTLDDGVLAVLQRDVLELRRGADVLASTSCVRRIAPAGTDRVIVQDIRSRRWELWTAEGRTERLPRADVAAAWGDARWWVVDGVLHGAGLEAPATSVSPAYLVAPTPDGEPPERPVPDGPAKAAWARAPVAGDTRGFMRDVAIQRDATGLLGHTASGAQWRHPSGGSVTAHLGELVVDGVVVDIATGRDVGPVPDGAQALALQNGEIVAAGVEGDDVVVRQGGREIARSRLARGVGAVAVADDLVYLGVGQQLVALDGSDVRWQVQVGEGSDRVTVRELRIVGELLLVRTLHPMLHFAPVWAFDRHTGDVVDVLDLEAP